ncbi:histidine--tRNA ligase [Campylobacterota bacterium]|nr:histidine--tRNA ligase [Campylobacterota bacterium]
MITALRGMKDIIDEAQKYEQIIAVASSVARRFGFGFIETPHLEETALFKRSVGESSDIVGKEMYEFIDKGGNAVCLRPEATAGVVRAFVEKKLDRTSGVKRFFYTGAMFRYERPQKGRLRLFHQFGVESFGEVSALEDASVILLAKQIFDELGIAHTLEINSLGCEACMPPFRAALTEFLTAHGGELCEDCMRRKDENPIRALDCKNPDCQTIYRDAPLIGDYLCESCRADFAQLERALAANGVEARRNHRLVRGLDYYTKTAFEFVSAAIGAQSAIAGGGRYDKLVSFLGGKPTPAVGFALGIERIYDLVQLGETARSGVYIGALDAAGIDKVFQIAAELRKRTTATSGYAAASLKSHLKAADRANAELCCAIGENELNSGTIWVKNLVTGEEQTTQIERWIMGDTLSF